MKAEIGIREVMYLILILVALVIIIIVLGNVETLKETFLKLMTFN